MAAVVERNIRCVGWLPFFDVIFTSVVKILLEYGADVNAVDEYNGRGNQHANSFSRTSFSVCDMLYADIACRFSEFSEHLRPGADFRGCTALHYAVLFDDEYLVKLLLESGADPTIKNELGYLPIHYCKSASIAKLLESENLTVRLSHFSYFLTF